MSVWDLEAGSPAQKLHEARTPIWARVLDDLDEIETKFLQSTFFVKTAIALQLYPITRLQGVPDRILYELARKSHLINTVPSLYELLRDLFPTAQAIQITHLAPHHIRIGIGAPLEDFGRWVTHEGEQVITHEGDDLLFARPYQQEFDAAFSAFRAFFPLYKHAALKAEIVQL